MSGLHNILVTCGYFKSLIFFKKANKLKVHFLSHPIHISNAQQQHGASGYCVGHHRIGHFLLSQAVLLGSNVLYLHFTGCCMAPPLLQLTNLTLKTVYFDMYINYTIVELT